MLVLLIKKLKFYILLFILFIIIYFTYYYKFYYENDVKSIVMDPFRMTSHIRRTSIGHLFLYSHCNSGKFPCFAAKNEVSQLHSALCFLASSIMATVSLKSASKQQPTILLIKSLSGLAPFSKHHLIILSFLEI